MLELAGKRVCVTGGAGFLGSHLVDRIKQRGAKEVFVPRSRNYDLTSNEGVKRLFRDARPEVIFHLAAFESAQPGAVLYANTMMGLQLIELARQFGVEKVIVAGSAAMYPEQAAVPRQEADLWFGYPPDADAPQAIAKRTILEQCRTYRHQYGFNAIHLVTACLYGPGESARPVPRLIRRIVEASETGAAEVVGVGDDSRLGELLYVGDAAEGFVCAAERYDSDAPCNLGSGGEISLRCLAEGVAELCGYDGAIRCEAAQSPALPQRTMDVSRAERKFGFRAAVDLQEGLERTIHWCRENRQ